MIGNVVLQCIPCTIFCIHAPRILHHMAVIGCPSEIRKEGVHDYIYCL